MQTIKNNKPSRKSGFVQGYFPIAECKKYQGEGPIIFRSSWERKFCLYCERNPEIVKWSSESVSLEYFNPMDNKYHRYFPDYIITLKSGQTFLIEVKPKAQLIKPKVPTRRTPKTEKSYKWSYETWIINMQKKEAATIYAKSRGWDYLIVDEDFFKNKSD